MPQPSAADLQLPWGLHFVPSVEGADVVTAALAYDHATARLQATLTNAGDTTARPAALRLAAEPRLPAAGGMAWLHGRYMQMDALTRAFGEPLSEGYDGRYVREAPGGGRHYVSHEQLALTLPARATPALFIGSLRLGRFFFDAAATLDADESVLEALELLFDLTGLQLAPGEELALPPIFLREGRDPWELAEEYAADAAREMHARVPAHVPSGWCSWYFFYDRVSEADVLANLEALRASAAPLDFVQIDDGYQSHTGDWLTPNAKFPSGMATLASRIAEAGYRPGLWLAPLVLHEESAALRGHAGMALRDAAGTPYLVDTWLGRCAVLDATSEEGEAWLRDVIQTVVREWGYTYLKLDALAFAAVSPARVSYSRPGTTAPGHLRRALEIIREAAGEETFVLGCTCHFGPAIGLVDAMRVGPDVKAVWDTGPNPSVRHAMRLALQRNWMHRRWWLNDPDCLILRDRDTALTEAEVRFLATGVALSGGMVVASDDLLALAPGRRDLALQLLPPPGIAARPAGLAEAPVPSTWRTDLGDARSLVGVLNWSNEPRWVVLAEHLRPGEIAFDCWEGRIAGMGDRLLRPHEAVLWQVTGPGSTPRAVGDSASLTYRGLFQRPVSGRIQLRNDLDRPRTVAIEARGQVFEVDFAPGEARWFE